MFPLKDLFVTIVSLCGISGFLALLIVISQLTIGNYGKVKIKINRDKEIEVEGGRSLLSSLMEKEIFIPSACGGRGSCGFCKLKVTSEKTEILATELPWLNDNEKQNNVRLSCQIKVKKNVEIEIPEELFNVKQYETRVSDIVDLTHDIKQVRLTLLNPQTISFKAGQYIQFEVPEYELTSERIYRAYSVSSAPHETKEVELEIRYVPNGICTTYVHKHLKIGDKVLINGPYGEFYLRDTLDKIIFVAGGSGMAPIKSILYDMLEKKIKREAVYFFGARSRRDLFLVNEMKDLESKLDSFKFYPTLSSALPEDEWTGETGLITKTVEKYVKTGESAEAYLCGSPGMIDACIEILIHKGIPKEKIYYDKFS